MDKETQAQTSGGHTGSRAASGSENLFSAYFHLMWGVAAGEIDPSHAAKKATLIAEEYARNNPRNDKRR